MDRDYLVEYQEKELDSCRALFADEQFKSASVADRLRMIYGAPLDREVVYCETGGIENLENYPDDKTIVLTVFPYKKTELFERHLGSLERFIEKSEKKNRIIPVVQSPLYYEGLDHLKPLFEELAAPSYFVRGQFAYATIMGEDSPELTINKIGGSSLTSIVNLMDKCASIHAAWIDRSFSNSECWESRYRRIGALEKESNRLKESLKYRYASVAYCLGEEITDEIILTFDYVLAARILLHLHILFDHVIAHGFGSHFSVDKNSDEGRDFYESKLGLVRGLEQYLCRDLEMLVPTEKDEYYKKLLMYEHPLQGIRLDDLKESDFEEISMRIRAQFESFRKKVEKLERKKTLTKRLFTISLLLMGGIIGKVNPALGIAVGSTGVETKEFKVPEWLFEGTVGTLEKLYKHNLAFFILNSKWERNA